jgi:hypothetical protein
MRGRASAGMTGKKTKPIFSHLRSERGEDFLANSKKLKIRKLSFYISALSATSVAKQFQNYECRGWKITHG